MSFAYQDDAKTIIFRAPEDQIITIPNQVKEIYGSSSGDYAFMTASKILLHVIFQEGCSLQKISNFAFYKCSLLEEIDLSKCTQLEYIGNSAFSDCSAAKTVVFPENSLKTIGEYAFLNCRTVKDIYIPASVKTIRSGCFQSCSGLKNFTFDPESQITNLPKWVFLSCSNLESIRIPKLVTNFANIFNGCNKLVKIEVDEQSKSFNSVEGVVYSIDNKTICVVPTGLTGEYTILEGVDTIGWCSFVGSQLSNVIFPQTLLYINDWAFSSAKIQYAYFPDSLKSVGINAFSSSALIEVTFPNTIDNIGNTCFFSCKQLTKVIMPDNYSTIGGGIFAGCSDKLNITFGPNSNLKVQEQKIAYTNDNATIILYFGDYEEIRIKSSVKTIGSSVFYSDKNIKRVVFDENSILETISDRAFFDTTLTEIVFPDSVKVIQSEAFMNCMSLASVTMGNSIHFINFNAFTNDNNLTSVEFKNSEYTIDHNVFQSCSSLKTVNLGNGPTSIGKEAFIDCKSLKELTIPNTVQTIALKAFKDSGLVSITFQQGSKIKELVTYLFDGCNDLETIVFPDSVKILGTYCFSNTKINNLEIPPSLESIDAFCFNNCGSLTTFTIPNDSSLKNIGFCAFYGCYSFEKIVCDNNKEFCLINGALYNKNVTKLIVVPQKSPYEFLALPETIKTIGQSAFLNCTIIKQIFFPSKSVEEIENNAFESCINLININLPSSVETVGREAFKNCKKLQCGLLIQSNDETFRKELVKTALMPKRCLYSCNRVCSCERKNLGFHSIHSMLFISLFSIISV